ncbi:ATP-binding protein, partial [Brevundimonas sp.]|uniref:ATP-binding protein n=1 Tax=Brevundimonas sp. TaxID=1871086 RepID=UPI002897453E
FVRADSSYSWRRFRGSRHPFQDWHDHIDEPALADAVLDRIVHSSFKMELAGESMRKLKVRG